MACWFKKELETQNPDSKIPFNYFGPIRVSELLTCTEEVEIVKFRMTNMIEGK